MKATRNYPLLLVSQFLGAFGDNVILAVILGPLLVAVREGRVTEAQQMKANILYTTLLFIPYVLLAPLAGYFNDRFSKTRGLILGNLLKVAGAGLAALSLVHAESWLAWGYFVVGIGACLYSPAKYGILPEILPVERLVKANGTVELLTLVAILTGTIGGAMMIDRLPQSTCFWIVVAIYAVSMGLNAFMDPTPTRKTVRLANSMGEFARNLGAMTRDARLARILVGTSLFWLCGAMLKMNFQPWGQSVLKLETNTQIALLGLWLSIGVMVGSVMAGRLYRVGDLTQVRRFGFVLMAMIAALGALEWLIAAGLPAPRMAAIATLIAAGIGGGLFLIPLNAALQAESHSEKLGKAIATQNLLENLAMLCGSGFAWLNVSIGFDPSQLFLALAALVLLVNLWLRIPPLPVPDPLAKTISEPTPAP